MKAAIQRISGKVAMHICDWASENGPSWRKLATCNHKTLISWVLYNILLLCKLYNVAY